jgi:iron complex transport system substrate-binding protein
MRRLLASVVAFTMLLIADARAATLPRVASINVCSDQLLLTLADPEQILGLSPYAREPARSFLYDLAANYPLLSGDAEDVLLLKADIIITTRYTKLATRQMLKRLGARLIELDAVETADQVKAQIRAVGILVGHPDRAEAAVARIDAALARAQKAASRRAFRVLPLERRGWVSGRDSLISSLLTTVGLVNAADQLGIGYGGFASLEAVVALRPDYLLMSEQGDFAEDEGRAFVLHPALERLYPTEKRLTIPERYTVCGGPMLADALDLLTVELGRLPR